MAFKKNATVANKTEWKNVVIPMSQLVGFWTNKETGKSQAMFKVAESTGSNATFFVAVKNIRVNADHTAFVVGMPEGEVSLSERVEKNGEKTYNKVTAECLADLGYIIEE